MRALKKDGILAVAYINKHFIFTYLAKQDKKYLNNEFMKKIIEGGHISARDKECFWTDAYFYSPQEIEEMMGSFPLTRIENIATDGIGILLRDVIESMNEEEYEIWLNYHMRTCKEPSLLGYSNHGLYIGRRK